MRSGASAGVCRVSPPTTSAEKLNATMIGYLYNNILPARAGEAARIIVLTQRSSSPLIETTGTVMVERVYDVVTILVIFFVAEPWLSLNHTWACSELFTSTLFSQIR